MEAGKKSGALITANTAKKQGRDIFAVPGDIDKEQSIGPNNLIKNGAKLVTSVEDILEEYGSLHLLKNSEKNTEVLEKTNSSLETSQSKIIPDSLRSQEKIDVNTCTSLNVKNLNNASKEALKVYESLTDTPLSAESIMLKTKIKLPQVFSGLTELEILDLVEGLPGGKYQKI